MADQQVQIPTKSDRGNGPQIVTVPDKSFRLGMDTRSAENQIQPGFVSDLQNGDIVEDSIRKRKGLQGYGGNLPLRATSLIYNSSLHTATLFFDSGVDFSNQPSTPLVISGLLSRASGINSGGPFTDAGTTVKYYPSFSTSYRRLLNTGTNQTLLVNFSETGIASTNFLSKLVQSTSLTDLSHLDVDIESVAVNTSTFQITDTYSNNTGATLNALSYYLNTPSLAGTTYIQSLSHSGGGSQTFTVSAATHALTNYNIYSQIQLISGGVATTVSPQSVTISTTGLVTVVINSFSAATYTLILHAMPLSNVLTGSVNASTTATVTFSGITSPWIFQKIYIDQTPGGTKEEVLCEAVTYDDVAKTASFTFTNNTSSAVTFTVYYEYGFSRSNTLTITDATISSNSSDTAPQVTVWGLDHTLVYSSSASQREGWVTHIDSYRIPGNDHVIAGLGGNLFIDENYASVGASYDYASLYPSLQAVVNSTTVIGPAFYASGATPARTRGYLTGTVGATSKYTVTSVSYDSGTGYTKYTISIPSMLILDSIGTPTTIGSVISTTANLEDSLTITNMSNALHEGTFTIKQVDSGVNLIHVYVSNSSITNSDWDDSGVGGLAGIFTDQIPLTASSKFILGDSISTFPLITAGLTSEIATNSNSSTIVVNGITSAVQLAVSLSLAGSRTSSVIAGRLSNPTKSPDVTNLVAGDLLDISSQGINRLLRVLYINPDSSRTINITASAGVATATLQSGDTTYLVAGKKIQLVGIGVYSGTQTILTVPSSTTFTFATSSSSSVTGGTLLGKTFQVDEEFSWGDTLDDTSIFQTSARWIPIEAPSSSGGLVPNTNPHYFTRNSYTNQNFIRSCMVVNNMYLTNNSDSSFKFDGTSNYRSGLPDWSPGLFATVDTGSTAKIVVNNPVSTPTAMLNANTFAVPTQDQPSFPVGSYIRHSFVGGSTDYLVTASYSDITAAKGYISVQKVSTGSIALGTTPTLTLLSAFRYYFRLNAIDTNNNQIASAVTGYLDNVVYLGADAAIHLKLVGFPVFDVYDYNSIQLQIYRTKANSVAPFYLINTQNLNFNNTTGYVNYTDTYSDINLTALDSVVSALKGQELGISWSDAPLAKCTTTLNNSLILANTTSYPQIDLSIVANANIDSSLFSGKIVTLLRDDSLSGSSTDMINTARYEWRSATTEAASFTFAGTDHFVFTCTSLPVSVAAGSWIYLSYSSAATDLTYAGWWQIASVSVNQITVNLTGAAAASAYPDRYTVASTPTDIPVLLGTDANLGQVSGTAPILFTATQRLGLAINTSMRMVDTSLSGMTTFTPWVMTRGGNDVANAGELVIKFPTVHTDLTPGLITPSTYSGGGFTFTLFSNGISTTAATTTSAISKVFPSRLLVSYPNYPEIFDNPNASLGSQSDSIIDVNSADGQEITAVIPFFSESAFGAAMQSTVILVLKTNSIWLVDISQKASGANALQRVESEGLGCTAPFSPAITKNGILFANESGIYSLRKNLMMQYVGKYLERNWLGRVDTTQLELIHGHQYGLKRQYRVSAPVLDSTTPTKASELFVYDHTPDNEDASPYSITWGAWSRYTSHFATGFANLAAEAYMAASSGRVFTIRHIGDETDYRDDSSAIAFKLDTRAMDFGDAGIRKLVDRVIIHFRNLVRSIGTTVSTCIDISNQWTATTSPTLYKPTPSTGTDTRIQNNILSLVTEGRSRNGVYFQVRVENSTIDEDVQVSGIDYRVTGKTARGILTAQKSQSK